MKLNDSNDDSKPMDPDYLSHLRGILDEGADEELVPQSYDGFGPIRDANSSLLGWIPPDGFRILNDGRVMDPKGNIHTIDEEGHLLPGYPGSWHYRTTDPVSLPSNEPTDAPGNRRVVKTARTKEEINAAAREGFRPLVKPVQPGEDIHYMVGVFQDPETGEITLAEDVRDGGQGQMVMDFTHYYPYHFPNPFAAYLVPRDIVVGEEVWLEDLIEDLVAVWGNQGYHPRLEAAPAVWTGSDFDIQFDPEIDADQWVG